MRMFLREIQVGGHVRLEIACADQGDQQPGDARRGTALDLGDGCELRGGTHDITRRIDGNA